MLRQQSQRDPVAPTATNDNCGVLTVTNDAPATFPKGDTIVTWTVVDTAGNTASCTLKVTVKDHEPPVLAGQGADATINCPASPVFTAPSVSDNCDPNP